MGDGVQGRWGLALPTQQEWLSPRGPGLQMPSRKVLCPMRLGCPAGAG